MVILNCSDHLIALIALSSDGTHARLSLLCCQQSSSGLVRGPRLEAWSSGRRQNQNAGSSRHGFLLGQSGDCFRVLDSRNYHFDGDHSGQAFGFGGLDGSSIFCGGRDLFLAGQSRGGFSFMKHLARWLPQGSLYRNKPSAAWSRSG